MIKPPTGGAPIIDSECQHAPAGRTDMNCDGVTDIFDVDGQPRFPCQRSALPLAVAVGQARQAAQGLLRRDPADAHDPPAHQRAQAAVGVGDVDPVGERVQADGTQADAPDEVPASGDPEAGVVVPDQRQQLALVDGGVLARLVMGLEIGADLPGDLGEDIARPQPGTQRAHQPGNSQWIGRVVHNLFRIKGIRETELPAPRSGTWQLVEVPTGTQPGRPAHRSLPRMWPCPGDATALSRPSPCTRITPEPLKSSFSIGFQPFHAVPQQHAGDVHGEIAVVITVIAFGVHHQGQV